MSGVSLPSKNEKELVRLLKQQNEMFDRSFKSNGTSFKASIDPANSLMTNNLIEEGKTT